MSTQKTPIKLFVAILLLAAALRLSALSGVPPGLHPDAAVNAIDAWRAATTHHRQVFYEANFGREGLLINLISYSFQIFGPSITSYKLPSALIGILSVAGMYLLGWLVSRRRTVGLLSAFFMAISFWMILFDRTGLRASVSVCCVVWTMVFFLLALQTRQRKWYALTGLVLGLGLNTYISFRLMPVILLVSFWYDGSLRGRLGSRQWRMWLQQHRAVWLTVLVSAVVVLPLFSYFVQHPDYIMGRANEVSVFAQPHWFLLLLSSTVANLGIFTFFGDPNWRHNISTQPLLDGIQSIFFIIGLIIVWRYVRRVRMEKKEAPAENSTAMFAMLTLFVAMIIPAATTYSPGGIPHALRIIDTAPAIYVFVALGATAVLDWAHRTWSDHQRRVRFVAGVIIIALILSSIVQYFGRWGMSKQVAHEFSQDYTMVATFADGRAKKGDHVYILSSSTEIEFLTINRPTIHLATSANITDIVDFKSDIVVDTTGNTNIVETLRALGWTEPSHPAWGEGRHSIVVLERPNR